MPEPMIASTSARSCVRPASSAAWMRLERLVADEKIDVLGERAQP
jgi:hypothetical protein